jgi:hypothetical protein
MPVKTLPSLRNVTQEIINFIKDFGFPTYAVVLQLLIIMKQWMRRNGFQTFSAVNIKERKFIAIRNFMRKT